MTALSPSLNTDQHQEEIDEQERDEIAGLTDNSPLQVEEQYQLHLDSEVPSPKPIEERGTPRALLVTGIVGGLMLLGFGLWLLIKPKPPTVTGEPEIAPSTAQEEVSAPEPDYRAKLALQNQTYDLEQSQSKPPSAEPAPKASPPAKIRTVAVRRQPLPPPPAVSRTPRTSPARIRPNFPPLASRRLAPTTGTADPVDAFKRWSELANLGSSRGTLPALNLSQTPEGTGKATPTKTPLKPPTTSPQLGKRPSQANSNPWPTVPAVNISLKEANSPTDNPAETHPSPGTYGILNRRNASSQLPPSQAPATLEIAFGTAAAGTVSTPFIWDAANEQANSQFHRFAVTLTKDLMATNGTVALPTGTVLVAEAASVNPGSLLVQASAIAIVTTDRQGTVRQRPIESGLILIQGAHRQPLVAHRQSNHEGKILQQDLTIGILSSLGRVGEVLTEPEQATTFNGAFGTTTTTRSRNPEIWSAVLDGLFNPLAKRMSDRSQQEINELLRRPTVAAIPVGTPVSVTTNGLITIER